MGPACEHKDEHFLGLRFIGVLSLRQQRERNGFRVMKACAAVSVKPRLLEGWEDV